LGQKICTLVADKQKARKYEVEWDASDFASGIYIYQLKANQSETTGRPGGQVQNVMLTKKLILLK
jgi:hypothetical protein